MFNFQGFPQRPGQDGGTTAGSSPSNSPAQPQRVFNKTPSTSSLKLGSSPSTSSLKPVFAPPGRMDTAAPLKDPSLDKEATLKAMTNAAAVWDNEMDSLDRKQEQLLNEQWVLLRTQIGSLMGGLAEMQMEMSNLKENVLTKEVEQVINKLLGSHEEHGAKHAGLLDRVDFLEKYIGESVENHDTHKVTFETRMEFIEGLLGDNADKHAAEIEAMRANMDAKHGSLQDAHSSLQDAISLCAKHDHASGLEERMGYIEKLLGESADKHATHSGHSATMETRLEYMENLLGDSADTHMKEIEALRSNHGSLEDAIKLCAKHDHASGLESRMEYLDKRVGFLENFIGESEQTHDPDHSTTLEARLEFIEATIGDSADKHAKELSAAQDKLKDLHGAINLCAKSDHHSSLEDRLEYMEQLVGDSADKHEKHMKEMGAHASKVAGLKGEQDLRDQKHASLEDRLEALEHKHGNTSEEAMRKLSTLEAAHLKMKSAHEELKGLERDESSGAAERHSLRDDNSRQMKEYWERELKARQAYQEQFKDLLQAERSSREVFQRDSEQRAITLERSLGLESNRLWVAIDKHTHDPKPPQQIVEFVRPQSYVTTVAQPPSTIVDVMDTRGHHHLEAMSSRGAISSLRMSSTNLSLGSTQTPWSSGHPIAPLAPMSPSMVSRATLPVAATFQSAKVLQSRALSPPRQSL